jgi:hypothetical protein
MIGFGLHWDFWHAPFVGRVHYDLQRMRDEILSSKMARGSRRREAELAAGVQELSLRFAALVRLLAAKGVVAADEGESRLAPPPPPPVRTKRPPPVRRRIPATSRRRLHHD